MLILFKHGSIKTPTDNVVEMYAHEHEEGQSFRIVVNDPAEVIFNYYRSEFTVAKFPVGLKTIIEGQIGEIPHVFINR